MDILKLAKEINKDVGYKEGGVMTSNTPALDIERIKVGSLTIDIITGGGLPRGRMVGIEGMESSGKSTIVLLAIASYQRTDDRPAMIIDSEHAFDRNYAKKLGVDIDRLLIVQPDNLEEASAYFQSVTNRKDVGLIAFDSLKASMPEKMIKGEVADHNIGLHAKMAGVMIGSVNPSLKKNDITAIMVNQQRENPGGYGGGKVSPAGNALKFYASIRLEIYRGAKKDDTTGQYNRGWAKTVKNKTAPPYQQGEYDMRYGTGIDVSTEVLDYGTDCGVLYKKGHSYYYDETFVNDPEKRQDHVSLGNGRLKAKNFLDDNVDLRDVLYDQILNTYLNAE